MRFHMVNSSYSVLELASASPTSSLHSQPLHSPMGEEYLNLPSAANRTRPSQRRSSTIGSGVVVIKAGGEFRVIASESDVPDWLMLNLRLVGLGSSPAARPGPGVYVPN